MTHKRTPRHTASIVTRSFQAALCGLAIGIAMCVADAWAGAAESERTYEPSDADIANPERGLYTQFTAREDGTPLEVEALRALRDDKITLILRLYYLKEFRGRAIDADRLELVRGDLDAVREAGVKCILRFAYNEAIGEPDAPIDVVLEHLDQLTPILQKNADVIAVAQAGFVGSWGEWHASTNDLREPRNAKRIVKAWLGALPESRFVQLRTPKIKSMLVGGMEPLPKREAWSGTPRSRMAHHNDCFLATFNDMGTYEDIEAEKNYLEQETATLPMGGETCHVSEFNAVENARSEFARFHWSYLNLGYHPEVIQAWRDQGFFAEVRRKLGYRLVLERASVQPLATAGGTMDLQLDLRNEGWAAPFNPRRVEIVLRSSSAEHTVELESVDPRTWGPDEPIRVRETLGLPAELPAGDYEIFLGLPAPEPELRDRPDYAIRLANTGLWVPDTGRHDLGLSVSVSAAP